MKAGSALSVSLLIASTVVANANVDATVSLRGRSRVPSSSETAPVHHHQDRLLTIQNPGTLTFDLSALGTINGFSCSGISSVMAPNNLPASVSCTLDSTGLNGLITFSGVKQNVFTTEVAEFFSNGLSNTNGWCIGASIPVPVGFPVYLDYAAVLNVTIETNNFGTLELKNFRLGYSALPEAWWIGGTLASWTSTTSMDWEDPSNNVEFDGCAFNKKSCAAVHKLV